MRQILLAAGAFMAAIVIATPPLAAADLNYDHDDYGSPYQDPRYGDVYRRPSIAPRVAEAPYRDDRYYGRYADPRYGGRDFVYSGPRRFEPRRDTRLDRDYRYDRRGCLDKTAIRERLRQEGWHDFELVHARPDVAVLKARQVGGDLYRLRVDRCTGEILRARLLDRQDGDSYAYRPPYRYTY